MLNAQGVHRVATVGGQFGKLGQALELRLSNSDLMSQARGELIMACRTNPACCLFLYTPLAKNNFYIVVIDTC